MGTLGTGLILMVCVYPFVFIMYFLVKNDGMNKSNGRFGVTLSKEQQKAPEVEQISAEYCKQMKYIFWVLMLTHIPIIFIPWFSIMITFWMIWVIASCFVFFIPFGIANVRLKELKLRKGWKEKQEQPVYVEMKDAGRLRRVKWYHFLPQSILSLGIFAAGMAIYGETNLAVMPILIGSFTGTTLLFGIMAVWMDKQKTQIISMDSDVNVNYGRAKKNLWKNFWVICSWINVVYTVSMFWALDSNGRLSNMFWAGIILYSVITVMLLFWLFKKKNALDIRYQDKMDMALIDNDDNWLWGMIYYNPKDKHSMVEKRVGIGTTINVATPVGKGFMIFIGGMLLLVPILCIWLILTDFTPIHLRIENNQLVAGHLKDDYVILLPGIEEVELLTELPKMSRNHGTGMDTLKKGSFRVSEEGSCQVFLNPQNGVFLKLEAYGKTYYLSGYDDEETMRVYEELK